MRYNGYTKSQRRNAIRKANKKVCFKKKKYKTSIEAWEWAEWYYIRYGEVSIPYRCICSGREGHYHLTHGDIGDLTHIPEEYRKLFETYKQKEF